MSILIYRISSYIGLVILKRGTAVLCPLGGNEMFKKLAISAVVAVGILSQPALAQDDLPKTLFTNVNIFDGVNDGLSEGLNVLVEGTKIIKIAEKISADGATVIDGNGGTLIPGLIDSHQHIMYHPTISPLVSMHDQTQYQVAYEAIANANKLLMMGITTIRDLGGPSIDLARAIDNGLVDGPRIYSSGAFISATSGHGDWNKATSPHQTSYAGSNASWGVQTGWSYLADGPDAVRWATRQVLASGAPQIKIMAGGGVGTPKDPLDSVGYSEAELRAAVEAAADYNTYVQAHAYNDESIQRCIRAGVKDIVHGHLLGEETIKMMAENDVWLGSLSNPHGLMDVPFFTEDNLAKARLIVDGYSYTMQMAKKHGVKMGFGTDAAGQMVETVLYELRNRVEFFTPTEVLRQATSTNAELLALSNTRNPYQEAPLGVIKEGAWADLLIYSGNPLTDINIAVDQETNLHIIMKNGVVYKNTLD